MIHSMHCSLCTSSRRSSKCITATNTSRPFVVQFHDDESGNRWVERTRTDDCQLHRDYDITSVRPLITSSLTQRKWQILVTDYENPADLQFKLAGVDVVISTITGRAQLALIDAAAISHVRKFIPSEFAGLPALRPVDDPFDQGRHAALQRLAQLESSGMISTVFSCGIFYERFGPGGMSALQLGLSSHIAGEGEYLMNFRQCRAEIPYNSIAIPPPYVCMTSAQDVARAVVAALDLTSWPKVFQLRGDRLRVEHIVGIAEQVRGELFQRTIHTLDSLSDALVYAQAVRQGARETQLQHLVATAQGHYDFLDVNWQPSFHMETFAEWLIRVWSNPV